MFRRRLRPNLRLGLIRHLDRVTEKEQLSIYLRRETLDYHANIHAVALACPGVDYIRLWPLPVEQPWQETLDPLPDWLPGGYAWLHAELGELKWHFETIYVSAVGVSRLSVQGPI